MRAERPGWLLSALRRRQQLQRFVIGGTGFSREYRELHTRLADEVQSVVVQFDVAHEMMVVSLDAALMVPDVVPAPKSAEVVAAS